MPLYIDPKTGISTDSSSQPAGTELLDTYRPSATQTAPTPTVNYNADGSRTTGDPYAEIFKPLDANAYAQKQTDIKAGYAKQIQDSIDSINSLYAPMYAREAENAKSRLGSTANINALSGQRGAPTGAATTEQTMDKNKAEVAKIDSEKMNNINIIKGNYAAQERADLNRAEDLRRSDTVQYKQYMDEEENRRTDRAKNKITDLISSNIGTENWDENDLQDYMKIYGYTDQNDAKKAIDYKIGANLAAKEAEAQQAQIEAMKTEADINSKNANTMKTQAEIDKMEADQIYKQTQDKTQLDQNMIGKGYAYVKTPGQRDSFKKQGYDVVEVGGRTYAKKPEPVKVGGTAVAKDALSLSKDEQAFYKDADSMITDLNTGKKSWGEAYNYLSTKYGAPADIIDSLLNKEKWSQPGAYENQLNSRKNIEANAFAQWLNAN
jgi:hypothetical protein